MNSTINGHIHGQISIIHGTDSHQTQQKQYWLPRRVGTNILSKGECLLDQTISSYLISYFKSWLKKYHTPRTENKSPRALKYLFILFREYDSHQFKGW